MDALRVSLLIIGIAIVVGIYFMSSRQLDDRQRSRNIRFSSFKDKVAGYKNKIIDLSGTLWSKIKPAEKSEQQIETQHDVKTEPRLSSEDIESFNSIIPDHKLEQTGTSDVSLSADIPTEQIIPDGEQLFVAVTIIGKMGRKFTGESILYAVEQVGLDYGPDDLFYYKIKISNGEKVGLLGLANIMEPGTFEPERMRTFDSPGLVLFLQLPAPIEARDAFDKLIHIGRELAQHLDGELCDDTRSVLTNQTIGHLREKIESYRFKQKMTQVQKQRAEHSH